MVRAKHVPPAASEGVFDARGIVFTIPRSFFHYRHQNTLKYLLFVQTSL